VERYTAKLKNIILTWVSIGLNRTVNCIDSNAEKFCACIAIGFYFLRVNIPPLWAFVLSYLPDFPLLAAGSFIGALAQINPRFYRGNKKL